MNKLLKPKFLFVNPPTPEKGVLVIRDLDRSGRKTREKTIWPQANLAYLAAVMKNDFDVEILDCIAEQIYWNEFEKIIQRKRPKYILTNIISSTLSNDLKTAIVGKRSGSIIFGVGSHVTALPAETMRNCADLDYIILGEAEETLGETIETLEAGKNVSQIRGLVWRDKDGQIIINENRPLIKDLDSLPIPLHELLPIKKYNLPFIGANYTFVMSDRGCPYGCIFCRSPIAWNRKIRSRSAQSIFEELKYLKKIGISNFAIHSDVFTLNRERDIELCKMMIGAKLNMRWICNGRVDIVDEELLKWMKKAGCTMIAYGIESGSQKVLDMSKKGITLEQIKRAVYDTYDAGIKVWGYFIIGLPGETWETVRASIDLSKELPLALANFAVGAPYPGTEFYNLVKEMGWLKSDNWEEFDQNYSAIVSYPEMSSGDIERAMKMAYKEWYFRPQAILSVLRGIKSFNDIRVLTDVVWEHLRWIIKR